MHNKGIIKLLKNQGVFKKIVYTNDVLLFIVLYKTYIFMPENCTHFYRDIKIYSFIFIQWYKGCDL